MGGSDSDSNVVLPRLKREDCGRTKHDSAFSTWKVLVGPTDWEDYSSGKEGATRYRVHNLPRSPGPGIYELGVAASHAKSGREVAKLDPRLVVVVYLGKADCVRTRLQQYGRSGAHLGRCSPAACEIDCKTCSPTRQLGLFEEVLSRGNPIVFRWATLNDKGDAQRAELSLLDTFDYAWNKGSNGSRRPSDIFRKLDEIASSTYHISSMARKLLPFRPREVGIRIRGKLLSEKKETSPQTGGENNNFLNGIFKFSKSRPRLVISESRANDTAISGTSPANESFSPLCGVILEDGSPCTKPTLQGRKRCSGHKGMRIWASNSVSHANDTAISVSYPANESFSPSCGVILEDGSPCTKPPVQGRKRCIEHKGMRIPASNSVLSRKGASSKIHELGNMVEEAFLQQGNVKNDFGTVCGVDFGVRCEHHKGMRINQIKKKHVGS
ncbi:protein EFFECTOR OF TRANSCRIPTION 2 isoform X2 [Rhodamnia argentea]|uniref:Protein EFFECTOR OF TRANSCRIPTION 2 isoform X2 n=1 Tax=Rhodamnia argentea TaxID=178133 RepID=A0A8B8P7V2_9MYRT|nr:protein EFFECTOR OF TRANSCRIPTION 2 isoform X2 [Rhodamnia argentea]